MFLVKCIILNIYITLSVAASRMVKQFTRLSGHQIACDEFEAKMALNRSRIPSSAVSFGSVFHASLVNKINTEVNMFRDGIGDLCDYDPESATV